MKINEYGLNIIKSFEGCRLKAYRCPSNVLTIGYGHTKNVKEGDVITMEQAEQFLLEDIQASEKAVDKLIPYFDLNVNQYSALVSFTFNCGEGNLKKLTANRTLAEIADKMLLYNKSNGKTLSGLVRRREAEVNLFIKSVPNNQTYKSLDLIADEVIRGLWGNGADRKNRLTKAGYSYTEVQKLVNKKLKGGA